MVEECGGGGEVKWWRRKRREISLGKEAKLTRKYEDMGREELKEHCRRKKLVVSGNKEQLKDRLIKATNGQLKLTLRSGTAKREREGGGPPAGEGREGHRGSQGWDGGSGRDGASQVGEAIGETKLETVLIDQGRRRESRQKMGCTLGNWN